MIRRLHRKISQIQSWLASVRGPADWPSAFLLAFFRTRPTSGDNRWARLGRRLFPQLTVRPKRLQGFSVAVCPASMSSFIIYEELFIHGAYDLNRLAFVPDVIMDCGAFEGYFSLLTRARFPQAKIVAFEPHPDNYTAMCSNFERNSITLDARMQAVSNRSGKILFAGAGFGGHLSTDPTETMTQSVQVVDLCDIIGQLAPARLLLKLDVEGEEEKILLALVPILPVTCALFFEWHHGEVEFPKIDRLLCKAGFIVERCRVSYHDDVAFVDAFAQRLLPSS